MAKIAIIVPTIRMECHSKFLDDWSGLIKTHNASLYTVKDGIEPVVEHHHNSESVSDVMGDYADLIYNHNDGVRNLGFAAAYRDGCDIFITLDDDVSPIGDTIADHVKALNSRFPITWMNTASLWMRGFPDYAKQQAQCVLSHGVWEGVADFSARDQLEQGTPSVGFPIMPIPRGVLFPMSSMNVAVRRELVPYFYQAPMYGNIQRYADIWCGIEAKKVIDRNGWSAVTGYACVNHNRASDPVKNFELEAEGSRMNENYGQGGYFDLYAEKRKRWEKFIHKL